ncbi:MAG TPA: hypothetical protein VIR55_09475 [Ignavibacteria bacterium]
MKTLLLFCLGIIFFNISLSQPGIYISSSYISDDNLFKNSNKNFSNISSSNINAFYNYFTDNSQLKFSYNFNLNSFNNFPNANNNINAIDIGYAYNFDDETILLISGNFSGKTVKEEYNIYKENDFSLSSSYDFSYNEIHSAQIRYNYSNVSYTNLPDFSYSEHVFGYTSTFTWQTKTTLFLDFNLGYKIYSNDMITYYTTNDTSFVTPKGYGYGAKLKTIINSKSISKNSPDNNLQFLFTTKIAQSIIDNLGVSLSYSLRKSIINNSRYILGNDYYFSNDNLFDDNYSYNENDFEMNLTYLIFTDLILKSSFEYQIKKYLNKYPDENNDYIERNDNKYLFLMHLSKNFNLFDKILEKLNIYLYYIYTNNNSNVKYYNYNNNIFGLGLTAAITF